jgi:large subunit ribosomal protein L4
VAFGPRPRDYSKKTPRSVRRLAFRKALSSRIVQGDVLTVDAFAVSEPKTRAFVSLLKEVAGDEAKTLVVSVAFDEKTYLAARNVKPTLLMTAAEVNTEHLLAFKKIVLVGDALQALVTRTRKND